MDLLLCVYAFSRRYPQLAWVQIHSFFDEYLRLGKALNRSSSAQQNKGAWIAVICLPGRTMARKMQHPECYHMLITGFKCFRNTGNTLCLNASSKAYMASFLLLLQPWLASAGMPDLDKIIGWFCCAGKPFVLHGLRRAGGDAHPQKERDCTIPFESHLSPKKSSLLSQRKFHTLCCLT